MYFPMMIQLEGQPALVVGGGTVALRKCGLLADFGAAVTAVAPAFDAGFADLPQVLCLREPFSPAHLEGAALVIAATDDRALNAWVSEVCRVRRIPVNVVDDPALCSFIVPAVLRRGDLTLAVSTGGKSPAAAAQIRRRLEAAYGPEWAEQIRLLGALRERLRQSDLPPEHRRAQILESVELDLETLRALTEQDI